VDFFFMDQGRLKATILPQPAESGSRNSCDLLVFSF
jgi:hypothetical protein